jgi:hypothetical protein
MPKYTVEVSITGRGQKTIEASTQDEANQVVKAILDASTNPPIALTELNAVELEFETSEETAGSAVEHADPEAA